MAKETRNETIDDDPVIVEFKDPKMGKWEVGRFLTDDGQWKIAQ